MSATLEQQVTDLIQKMDGVLKTCPKTTDTHRYLRYTLGKALEPLVALNKAVTIMEERRDKKVPEDGLVQVMKEARDSLLKVSLMTCIEAVPSHKKAFGGIPDGKEEV